MGQQGKAHRRLAAIKLVRSLRGIKLTLYRRLHPNWTWR